MAVPPRSLCHSFVIVPSAAASTGVSAGAMISIASCVRPSARLAVNVSTSWSERTPATGIIRLIGPTKLGASAGGETSGGAGEGWAKGDPATDGEGCVTAGEGCVNDVGGNEAGTGSLTLGFGTRPVPSHTSATNPSNKTRNKTCNRVITGYSNNYCSIPSGRRGLGVVPSKNQLAPTRSRCCQVGRREV